LSGGAADVQSSTALQFFTFQTASLKAVFAAQEHADEQWVQRREYVRPDHRDRLINLRLHCCHKWPSAPI
jgi:hypothetical protein